MADSLVQTDQVKPAETPEQTPPQGKLYEVNGQQMSADQIVESYKHSQSELTKKSQELAEMKKAPVVTPPSQQIDEMEQLADAFLPYLEKRGLAKTSDIQALKEEQKVDYLLRENPSLAKNEKLLRLALKAEPNKAIEDVIQEYGLNGDDRLSRAKGSSDVIGTPSRTPKAEKSVADLNAAELAEWEKKNNVGRKGLVKFQPV
jgi:hypothetical protein